jgi:hypothetical protein
METAVVDQDKLATRDPRWCHDVVKRIDELEGLLSQTRSFHAKAARVSRFQSCVPP